MEHRRPHWGTMSQWRLLKSVLCAAILRWCWQWVFKYSPSLERDEQSNFRGYKESKATHWSFYTCLKQYIIFSISVFHIISQKGDMQRDVQISMPKKSNNGINAERFFLLLFVCLFLKCSAVPNTTNYIKGVEGAWINKAQNCFAEISMKERKKEQVWLGK